MHERAVEHRVALAQKRDVPAGFQMRRYRNRRFLVETGQRIAIGRIVEMCFVGHRVIERQLDMRRLQPTVDDRARVAPPSRLGEIGDDGRRRDDLGGLDGGRIGIAGPDPDAIEAAKRTHSTSLASAFTAAAAIALPPLRPRTMMAGKPLSTSASFDSAAPTKPTGMPIMAAGRGAPAAMTSSRRNRAVGALPMATTAP